MGRVVGSEWWKLRSLSESFRLSFFLWLVDVWEDEEAEEDEWEVWDEVPLVV